MCNESSSSILKARMTHGELCNIHNLVHRSDFISCNGKTIVTEYEDKTGVIVDTPKGSYRLNKNDIDDTYEGFGGEYKISVVIDNCNCTLVWTKIVLTDVQVNGADLFFV